MSVSSSLGPLREAGKAGAEGLDQLLRPVAGPLAEVERLLASFLCSPFPEVQRLLTHLERFSGKRLRPALLLLCHEATGGQAPEAPLVAACVELLHLATLCHDDVLDGATKRRRVETLNAAWGNKAAVMTGDLLLAHFLERLSGLNHHAAWEVLPSVSREICEGEILQIAERGNFELTEAQYYLLIEKKTARLFGAACRLGGRLSGASEAVTTRLHQYGIHAGRAFQIIDDILDLTGMEATLGKSLGCDLRNGEITLPVIRLLKVAPQEERPRILTLLAAEGDGAGSRQELLGFLTRHKCINHALARAEKEALAAMAAVEFLPESPARRSLYTVPRYVLERPA